MTIPEAVGLVMETCAMAHNGERFVLDMGNPVKILDLVENMISLSDLKPYEDIDIVEIGLRPGEKLYEELLMKTEELDKTENEMIFIERDSGLNRDEMEEKLKILSEAVKESSSKHGHHDAVLDAIRATVPTYHSPEEINERAAESEEMLRAVGGDRTADDVVEKEDDDAGKTADNENGCVPEQNEKNQLRELTNEKRLRYYLEEQLSQNNNKALMRRVACEMPQREIQFGESILTGNM